MGIPCGHGLGGGITLVAGFPLPDEFLDYFYDNIYKAYGHIIDFQGREDDFGALHITIFALTGTKKGQGGGKSCRISREDKEYYDLEKNTKPLDIDRDFIPKIKAVIHEVSRTKCFSLRMKSVSIDNTIHNVRLNFTPSEGDTDIISNLLKVPEKLNLGSQKRGRISSGLELHCSIGRLKVPFCYKSKEEEIRQVISDSIKDVTLLIPIDRLKLIHYRRSSLLGINGYILLPLVSSPPANSSIVKCYLSDDSILSRALGID